MLSAIGAVLLGVLKLVLIAASITVLLWLCGYLLVQAVVSAKYWAAYTSNKKIWPYDRKFTEILWAHVIAASTGITMMLLFAFQQIADALGYYFLSVWTPILGYYVVALVIATNLHKFWTDGEVWKADIYRPPPSAVPPKRIAETTGNPVAVAVEETNTLAG